MVSLINRTFGRIKVLKRKIYFLLFKKKTHGELIKELIDNNIDFHGKPKVFIETGCGVSTLAFAEYIRKHDVTIYSCDTNIDKVNELKSVSESTLDDVEFVIGNSLESLEKIVTENSTVDFLFLDSAASAMYTFDEFKIVENCLRAGSVVLIDNAAIPGAKNLLSPVRKGKILVPYLLSSPYWEVTGYPDTGDSMVAAIKHSEADYADSEYEDPEYIDFWRKQFENEIK